MKKGWIVPDFFNRGDSNKGKQRQEKASTSSSCNKAQIINNTNGTHTNISDVNFHNMLKPKCITDLAVHPKKIKEVESWLQTHVGSTNKNVQVPCKSKLRSFLLITGPTGCGKTTTVRVLCQDMGISVQEWLNPMDPDYENDYRGPNQVNRFSDFLSESKWSSLLLLGAGSGTCGKVILLRELPNALVRCTEEFCSVLEQSYYNGTTPIIFICTDTGDNNSMQRVLFTPEVMQKYNIADISFNPCAATLLKSGLKRAQNIIKANPTLEMPTQTVIDGILATSMGDIRTAMNQLYFASLLEKSADASSAISKFPKKRKRNNDKKNDSKSNFLMSRDDNLSLFRGLGRVLNPKRDDNGLLTNCDFEKIVEEFNTQPGIFVAFLFENYLKYFGDFSEVSQAADVLSFCQTFLDKWTDGRNEVWTTALWISVMGLMVSNKHRVSAWNPIRGPVKIKKSVCAGSELRNLSATDLFYYNIIAGESNFQSQIKTFKVV